jgi:GNAT superfamily N-acetyltransferase
MNCVARRSSHIEVTVRPLGDADIPQVVELRRLIWPDDLMTPESMAWGIAHADPSDHVGRWVAAGQHRVIGFAVAGRQTWSAGEVGFAYAGVRPDFRRRGVGGRLWDEVEAHLAPLGMARILSGSERNDEDSARFLRRRGFRHTRDDQAWSVDPRAVDVGELGARRAAAERAGLRLVPIRELLDRPRAIFRLTRAVERDIPADVPIAQAYESWKVESLGTPLFEPDASFCVLDGDLPVALTWLLVDHAGGRARHGITGTLSAYRHRGLARLAKLASIAWLAEHGISTLYTDNDTQNRDMLALNANLGFRPLTVFAMWVRDASGG